MWSETEPDPGVIVSRWPEPEDEPEALKWRLVSLAKRAVFWLLPLIAIGCFAMAVKSCK